MLNFTSTRPSTKPVSQTIFEWLTIRIGFRKVVFHIFTLSEGQKNYSAKLCITNCTERGSFSSYLSSFPNTWKSCFSFQSISFHPILSKRRLANVYKYECHLVHILNEQMICKWYELLKGVRVFAIPFSLLTKNSSLQYFRLARAWTHFCSSWKALIKLSGRFNHEILSHGKTDEPMPVGRFLPCSRPRLSFPWIKKLHRS